MVNLNSEFVSKACTTTVSNEVIIDINDGLKIGDY